MIVLNQREIILYRWQVVATYINKHSNGKTRSGKECLARAKNLKESELKQVVNQKAFEKFQEKHSVVSNQVKPSDGNISTRHGLFILIIFMCHRY